MTKKTILQCIEKKQNCTYRLHVCVHVVEVVEDGRLLLVLLNVIPHGQPGDVGPDVQVAVRVLGVRLGRVAILHQPAGLHSLKLVVQHERAEAVRHIVVREEPQEVFVVLKCLRKLTVDLQCIELVINE